MINVSVVLCPNEETAIKQSAALTVGGADVNIEKIVPDNNGLHPSQNCTVGLLNLLTNDVWVVTGIK